MKNEIKKYEELLNFMKEQIKSGRIMPGQKIPSENELVQQFGVSRQTVRRAIGVLEEQGVVRRVRGSGTFLNDQRKESRESRNRIAVITTYVDSYIFPRIIQGIENHLFERGYSVQLSFTNNTLERERSVLSEIIGKGDVAGVIVEGTKSGLPNPNIPLYRQLLKKNIPIIFINTFYPELNVPHVSLDDVQAAHKAVEYLIGKGHKDIGAILKLDDGQGRLRYLGYLRAMDLAGLRVTDSRMVWIDTDESKQLAYCKDKIMNRLESCTALFCYNDQIAMQLIRMLSDNHIRVPEDVSVISIDDADLAILSEVPITSLPHPKEKLGEKAAELLLYMIESEKPVESFEFDTRIIERSSVVQYCGRKNG